MLSRKDLSDTLKSLLTLALLAGVFFIGAGVITYLAVRGRTIAVPNVVGKSQKAAKEAFDEAGLRMEFKSPAYNDRAPADTVTDQSPTAGTIVKTGQIVRVSLSLGAAPVGQNAQK
ncbi:MAG TPA: PASTA domain-containing protein [Blastocatellia bacterium]